MFGIKILTETPAFRIHNKNCPCQGTFAQRPRILGSYNLIKMCVIRCRVNIEFDDGSWAKMLSNLCIVLLIEAKRRIFASQVFASMLKEMAWYHIGAKPFIESMLTGGDKHSKLQWNAFPYS